MTYIKNNILKTTLKNFFFILSFIFIFLIIFKPHFFLQTKVVNFIFKDLGFELKKVEVLGNHYVRKSEIINNIKFINCESLFCLDLMSTKKLIEGNNWIKSVKLKLILPAQLKITIKEEEPYFIYKNEKKLVLLNIKGNKIDNLDYISDEFKNLVLLKGEGAINNIPKLLSILSLNNNISGKVTAASLIAKRRWSLKYLTNIIIDLPESNPEKAFYKIAELEQKYGLLSNKLKKIDLRVSDRMIIQLDTEEYDLEENNI